MLINKIKIPLVMNDYEPITKVANNVTDREGFLVKDGIIGIFTDYIESFFILFFFLVVLRHVGWKLLTFETRLHSDEIIIFADILEVSRVC